jgi:hypothetical protein
MYIHKNGFGFLEPFKSKFFPYNNSILFVNFGRHLIGHSGIKIVRHIPPQITVKMGINESQVFSLLPTCSRFF